LALQFLQGSVKGGKPASLRKGGEPIKRGDDKKGGTAKDDNLCPSNICLGRKKNTKKEEVAAIEDTRDSERG